MGLLVYLLVARLEVVGVCGVENVSEVMVWLVLKKNLNHEPLLLLLLLLPLSPPPPPPPLLFIQLTHLSTPQSILTA